MKQDKCMKKLSGIYEEILNEGPSSILFHFTYLGRLENILNENTFFLTPAISKSEKTKGRNYFMSFTRGKSNRTGYGTKFTNRDSVRIKIDGQKLGNNYKVIPIDYWQYPKTPEFMKQTNGDEMEDRVISNKNEIPNASKYIIEVDILMGEKGLPKSLLDNIKRLGIKLNVYNNSKDFGSADTNRTVKPIISTEESNIDYPEFIGLNLTLGTLTYKEPKIKDFILKELGEMGVSDEKIIKYKSEIDEYHEKLDYYLRPNDDYHLTDLTNSLDSELHNSKRQTNKVLRYVVMEFMRDMKRTKSSTLKEYLLNKLYKDKKTQEQFNQEFINKLNETFKKIEGEVLNDLNKDLYNNNGDYLGMANEYKPLLELIDGKINLLKNYIYSITNNNNDMYRLTYLWTISEFKRELDFTSGIDEVVSKLDGFDEYDIENIIYKVLWAIDDISDKEISRIKNENKKQWE